MLTFETQHCYSIGSLYSRDFQQDLCIRAIEHRSISQIVELDLLYRNFWLPKMIVNMLISLQVLCYKSHIFIYVDHHCDLRFLSINGFNKSVLGEGHHLSKFRPVKYQTNTYGTCLFMISMCKHPVILFWVLYQSHYLMNN